MKRAFHSVGGLFVRSATALGKDVLRLEVSPSDSEARDFFKHINRLGNAESFAVEVPADMLESMVSPEEFGSREHKIATLQGNCINLKMSVANDNQEIEVLDASPDLTYIMAGNEKTGFRPTIRFNRLFRQCVSGLADSCVFNHIRNFFSDSHGFLLPHEGEKPLKPYQKHLVRILSPYSQSLCRTSEQSRELGHAAFEGDFLTVEQRLDSFSGVLMAERTFASVQPNNPIYGKVTLSDVVGLPTENRWMEAVGEKLDRALGQSQRLDYAVTSLDSYVQSKLPLRIAANMEKQLDRSLSETERIEVRNLFDQFMAGLLVESDQKLQPLEEFCDAVEARRRSVPKHGLAVLNYLARDTGLPLKKPVKMSNGAKLDFGRELSRLVADPRSFGVELPNHEATIQQAAQVTLLNYVSRETLRAYWGISEPIPCTSAFQALQAENEQKVTDRFTKTRYPLANPADIYRKFEAARQLLTGCASAYLCTKGSGVEMLAPPRSMLQRLSVRSAGVPDVTRSRGLLLRTACAIYRTVPDAKADNFLKEISMMTGRSLDDCAREASFLVGSYNMSRAEAVVALALHEAVDTDNQRLAEKLAEFGKQNVPEYNSKLEAALDSRVRVQSLTPTALARLASESPEDVVKALSPEAQIQGELVNSKTSAVAGAAMKVLQNTLRDSLEFFKTSLPASLEFKNIEGSVYSGPQSAKIVSELVEESMEGTLSDYFRLASISDPEQREQQMNVRAATLAERAEQSKDALEIEADARCYPSGRSPKRVARDLLAEAFNKAILGSGKFEMDPYTFAPPSFATP
jgi:hypothetical protein